VAKTHRPGTLKKNMPLEVAIENKCPAFRLAVEFTADGAPAAVCSAHPVRQTMTLRANRGAGDARRAASCSTSVCS